jgi:hypothetical protein
MKKSVTLLCIFLFVAIPAFAGKYDIILKDGTEVNVDSYRSADGGIYYMGNYGIEAFIDGSMVNRIVDLDKQAKDQELKSGVTDLSEDSIRKMFDLVIGNFIKICKAKHPTLNPSLYDYDTMQYEVNKTVSSVFPYEGKLIIDNDTYYEHYHIFRFNANSKKWEFLKGIQAFPRDSIPKTLVKTCVPEGSPFDIETNNPCPVFDDTIDSLSIQNGL